MVAALLVAAGAGGANWLRPGPPGQNSADAGFLRDMSEHHAQAVTMSMAVRDRSRDDSVRGIAYDIALTQQAEIGMMRGWLLTWKLRTARVGPPMTWADAQHRGHGAGMPGMATAAELQRLTGASGRDADALFLRLMLDHHRGGLSMAQAALDRVGDPQVRRFARLVWLNQTDEITQMRRLLQARGLPAA
jgi:uncharacterized protein (DUF305 family)